MGKPLRLLNLTLGLVALLIAGALAKTWVAPAATTPTPTVAKPSHEPITVAYNRPARPPLAQFDVLLEKNPFKQPPPVPARRPAAGPPPRPLPTLSGTILVGDEWRAIVNDKGKGDIYAVGQEVGGGIITAIKEDRIVLNRGDSTAEVLLKGAIELAPPAPGQAQPPAQPASSPPLTLGVPPGPVSRKDTSIDNDKYEKKRLKEEEKALKQELKALRRQQKNQ